MSPIRPLYSFQGSFNIGGGSFALKRCTILKEVMLNTVRKVLWPGWEWGGEPSGGT